MSFDWVWESKFQKMKEIGENWSARDVLIGCGAIT